MLIPLSRTNRSVTPPAPPVLDTNEEYLAFQLRRRRNLIAVIFFLAFGVILAKLFHTQVVQGSDLAASAENQYLRSYQLLGSRGRIYSQDGALIVGNEPAYRLFLDRKVYLDRHNLKAEDHAQLTPLYQQLAFQIAPLVANQYPQYTVTDLEASISTRLFNAPPERRIVNLVNQIDEPTKNLIQASIDDKALGFDPFEIRAYPEASLAAQIVGHVAKNDQGEDIGYYGVEGELDRELKGRLSQRKVEVDSHNQPISLQKDLATQATNGRDVYLTIRRDVQYYLEKALADGLEKYGARKGEIIVMEPSTGKIIGWATAPTYSPKHYQLFEPELRRNPSISEQFEPGSIFKVITMSAGIDSGKVSPSTICPNCGGPLQIGDWTITNWNNKYHPGINMTEALEESDNTALTFVGRTIGANIFQEYLDRFMIGPSIGFDMQEDQSTTKPGRWGEVELANRSFGQGISVNSMQMMRAVGAIANRGQMMQPQIVEKVVDPITGEVFQTEPVVEGQPISTASAQIMNTMLKSAATHGEAKWIMGKSDLIAGKTGTAQVPDQENGGYKTDETMATFIGYAPADNPQFLMLVKLDNPTSSQWAAETAAPLWFAIAERLFILLSVEV